MAAHTCERSSDEHRELRHNLHDRLETDKSVPTCVRAYRTCISAIPQTTTSDPPHRSDVLMDRGKRSSRRGRDPTLQQGPCTATGDAATIGPLVYAPERGIVPTPGFLVSDCWSALRGCGREEFDRARLTAGGRAKRLTCGVFQSLPWGGAVNSRGGRYLATLDHLRAQGCSRGDFVRSRTMVTGTADITGAPAPYLVFWQRPVSMSLMLRHHSVWYHL